MKRLPRAFARPGIDATDSETTANRELYQRKIDATGAEIDALVYELYGVTEEEVEVIEAEKRLQKPQDYLNGVEE